MLSVFLIGVGLSFIALAAAAIQYGGELVFGILVGAAGALLVYIGVRALKEE